MTREEELKLLKEYIDKNGVIELAPDERGPEMFKTVWTKSDKKKRKLKKMAQALSKEKV